VIKSKPSLYARLEGSVSRLLSEDVLPELIVNLNNLTRDAQVMVDEENRRMLKKIIVDLAKVTHAVAAHSAEIDRTLMGAAQAMQNFAQVTKSIDEQLPQMIDETKTSFVSFQKMTQDIARVAAVMENALTNNRGNIEQLTGQTLADIGGLVFELRELTATFQRLAKEVDEEPSILVFGRSRQLRGPGE